MKKRLQRIPRSFSIDSGVLIAYFLGEDLGELVRSSGIMPPKGKTMYCSRTMISELFYILCRRRGESFAREVVSSLLTSGYLTILSTDEIDMEAGRYKCSRALSLADCYVQAVAKVQHVPAVFAKREDDLKKELEKKLPFDVRLLFLEDEISK